MSEAGGLLDALKQAGGDASVFSDERTAHVAVAGCAIKSMRLVGGLSVEAKETSGGIEAEVSVEEGVSIERPVHLCFGILHAEGSQEIRLRVRLKRHSSASFIAHCIFPEARNIRHLMDAGVEIEEGACMKYSETHFHGPYGGIYVNPAASVNIGKGGKFLTDFNLTSGRVGKLDIDYSVTAGEDALAELTAKVFGRAKDEISIKDAVMLNGKGSRSLIKLRVALMDDARAVVTGITGGNAEGARGHVDCLEIVRDRAVARAMPIVNVSHPLAKVTHEAAIGSVDRRQLETLMSRGLSPEEAVDAIVKGMLR